MKCDSFIKHSQHVDLVDDGVELVSEAGYNVNTVIMVYDQENATEMYNGAVSV